MNTPAHCIINLALLGRGKYKKQRFSIILGALLPDLSMFIFYFVQKFYFKSSENLIWKTLYYESHWQAAFDFFHSIPIAFLGLLISLKLKSTLFFIFFASIFLHIMADFPLHHDDGHHHFFPFSDWVFVSPISYWDPAHYGYIFAPLEAIAVLLSCYFLYFRYPYLKFRLCIVLIATLYAIYLGFYLKYW